MKQDKLLNNNEIDCEKEKLKQEIKRLDIYNNCNYYDRDQLLCYFPNRATEIIDFFYKNKDEKHEWYVLKQEAKEQLQNIIMDELCSLLYPCIEKGYKVKQLDGDSYNSNNQKYLICLNTPENDKNIGISIDRYSKIVSTNVAFYDDDEEGHVKKRCLHNSGIQINDDKISIYNCDMDYTLIIYPNDKDIKLTDFTKDIERKIFYGQNDEIFQKKEDIMPFFSTLSFAEIEQVLQILNKHLKDKKYDEVDIKKVLEEIKNTIEENRKEEKRNEENSINNSQIDENNIIKKSNENTETVLNEIKDKIDEKKNENNNINNKIINNIKEGNNFKDENGNFKPEEYNTSNLNNSSNKQSLKTDKPKDSDGGFCDLFNKCCCCCCRNGTTTYDEVILNTSLANNQGKITNTNL